MRAEIFIQGENEDEKTYYVDEDFEHFEPWVGMRFWSPYGELEISSVENGWNGSENYLVIEAHGVGIFPWTED